jgi:ankyrin repeat protein
MATKQIGKKTQRELGLFIRACAKGDTALVRGMLKKGFDPDALHENTGSRPLHGAAGGGHLDIVKLLLRAGADVNLQETWKSMPPKGTPLENAAARGHLNICKLLVKYGADLNKVGDFTPLRAAAAHGQSQIVRFLLRAGAHIAPPSILRVAVWARNKETVRLLIEAGADVHSADDDGRTLLHIAAPHKTAEIMKLLLKAGIEVDRATKGTNETALHLAAQRGGKAVVEALLEAGAAPKRKGLKGKDAVQWAKTYGRKDIADFIKEYAHAA